MAEKFNLKKFMKKLANFISNLIKYISKADRRVLIMSAVGIVVAIVLIVVIIVSVAGGKDDKKEETPPASSDSYITEEPSTDDELAGSTVQPDGAGYYTVTISGDSSLNMRPTAGTEYSVMATIPGGTRIQVLFIDDSDSSTSTKGWAYIEYNGKRGWVSMDYLTAAE